MYMYIYNGTYIVDVEKLCDNAYVHMYVRMHVCMYVCMYIICILYNACMYVIVYLCM